MGVHAIARETDGRSTGIVSIFCMRPRSRYIYIEAHSMESVRKLLHGQAGVLKKLPITSISPFTDNPLPAPGDASRSRIWTHSRGDWVRLKRGPYKGDLALITHVEDNAECATVAVVPRIPRYDIFLPEARTAVPCTPPLSVREPPSVTPHLPQLRMGLNTEAYTVFQFPLVPELPTVNVPSLPVPAFAVPPAKEAPNHSKIHSLGKRKMRRGRPVPALFGAIAAILINQAMG